MPAQFWSLSPWDHAPHDKRWQKLFPACRTQTLPGARGRHTRGHRGTCCEEQRNAGSGKPTLVRMPRGALVCGELLRAEAQPLAGGTGPSREQLRERHRTRSCSSGDFCHSTEPPCMLTTKLHLQHLWVQVLRAVGCACGAVGSAAPPGGMPFTPHTGLSLVPSRVGSVPLYTLEDH